MNDLRILRILSLVLATTSLDAQSIRTAPPMDWNALASEAQQLLVEYIRINTTNPPGNELAGARFLERMLMREGIETFLLDTANNRANLYARLRGTGIKRAIALVHHIDVVPADVRYWSVDPYGGIVRDGYIWGRGAIDMKGHGIAQLMAIVAIKRSGQPISRDIVLIANCDEELLGAQGASVFVAKHSELLRDVEFLLTEGAWNRVEEGKLQFFSLVAAEKLNYSQRITVKGTPSHASRPNKDNPVVKLLTVLSRITAFEAPLTVTPEVDRYFRDLESTLGEPYRTWVRDVKAAIEQPAAREWILSDPFRHALLRNTVQPTVLAASNKTNVVPAEASAELDIRLLPGQDPDAFLRTLKQVVGDSTVVWQRVFPLKPNLQSSLQTELFAAIEGVARIRQPEAPMTTTLSVGGTDMPWYRQMGIVAYGIDPFTIERSEQQRGLHGNDERLPIATLGSGIHFLYDILRNLD